MSSTYGESVKFYERMSNLHGQLKTYDEKQYNLQDELERLLKQPRSSEVDLNESPRQASRFQPSQNGKLNDVTEEERRRQRNQIILGKIKQLESNASVFAARSEKLRMMKREYETLVKKYMSTRKSPHSPFDIQPHLPTGKMLDNLSSRLFTSTGVNTVITGPIKPVEEPEVPSFSAMQEYERNYAFTNGMGRQIISRERSHVEYQLAELQNEKNSQEPDNFHQTIGRFAKESMTVPIQNEAIQNLNDSKYNHNQNLNEMKPRNLRRGKDGDEEDSMTEKLRHNPYFDLSTTSESELTSAKNAIKKKMLPVNINLDDTTQSDTFSLSMHVPTKLSSKTKLGMSSHLLNLSLTSEASESTARTSQQPNPQLKNRASAELTKLINEESDVEKSEYVQQQPFTGNNTNTRRSSLGLRRTSHDNDNELELLTDSDSSTTSPGDSVMDSVQNRTLNESLPQDRTEDANKEPIKTVPQAYSSSLGKSRNEMDVFLVSDRDKLINESFNKSDEEAKIASSTFTRPSSSKAEEGNLILNKGVAINAAEQMTGDQRASSPLKVPSNPVDVLNNFTKIEDEFTIGNDSLEEIESWERNTISLDDKRNTLELKGQAVSTNDYALSEKTVPTKQEVAKQQKDSITPNQPSRTGVTATSASSRRVKLKLDYDSDSDVSDAGNKGKAKKEGNTSTTSQAPQKENPVDSVDDEFDDFFDI